MKELYIEPFSGLAGDMLLSAFCGLADYYEEIIHLPEKLNLPDGKVVVESVIKNGIVCKYVRIIDLNKNQDRDHDHVHQHDRHEHDHHGHDHLDHKHDHQHEHHHSHDHEHHDHDHGPDIEPEDHHHHHRHLKDIIQIIEKGAITDQAKQIAKAIFTIIGKSESKIHDMDLETIHFHEVSGVDSILDIVGCAVLIDRLQINKTISTPICTGYGMVKTQHGVLPVPAPATADILIGMPTYTGQEEGERVTPTGAAILKYLNPDFSMYELQQEKIAYGPGQKNFISPNVVRVSIVSSKKKITEDSSSALIIVETNIDDGSAELLGLDFQNDLTQHGGIDFYFTAIQMKKGRPGLKLAVLVAPEDVERLSNFILEHSPSIGLRHFPVNRTILERRQFEMSTPYGPVQIKEVTTPSGAKRYKIEYESLQALKSKHNISILNLQNELYPLLSKKKDHEKE